MRLFIFIALAVIAGITSAQTIYECRHPKTGVIYQNEPCAPGTKVAAVKTYEPIHDDPRAAERLRQTEAAMNARAANRGSVNYGQTNIFSPQSDPKASQRARCTVAKANREETLARVGLKRTYALLQRLDAEVDIACREL